MSVARPPEGAGPREGVGAAHAVAVAVASLGADQ
jgi:hypothetical protein